MLHLPGDDVPERAPLVVALAGLGQPLEELRTWLPIEPVAMQHGFVVVYPEAIERRWSYWPGGGVQLPGRGAEEVDDVGFIPALAKELVAKGIADPLRLYVTGVSRGALMTWTLACERSELFAAVAPLSSPMIAPQVEACRPSRAIPVIAVASTADPVQPYDGVIQPPPLPRLVSIPESMSYWWRRHGCTAETVEQLPHLHADDPSRVERHEWTGCAQGGPVVFYRVNGGDHEPPSLARDPALGQHNRDMETAAVLWNAFSSITLRKAP